MQDNGRPHTARTMQFLEAETIQCMDYLACSPNHNLVEYAWDTLGRRVGARPMPLFTVQDKEISFLQEWNSIPQSLIDNHIASMINRYVVV
ncbi:hypothetical protein TNCV_5046911 [Trichonephila clavipes]|nr:hypothetical protein TNCV_5046911 [Trichonephila clavipes]